MNFGVQARDWLAQATGIAAPCLEVTPLRGANSSAVYAVQSAVREADAARFVLRVFDDAKWLSAEPDLAVHEAAALDEAARCYVEAPQLVAFEANDVGFGGPVVLMSHLAGRVELRPDDLQSWLAQLAETLTIIHSHKAPDFGWDYRSWVNLSNLQVPTWATQPRLWERAIALWHNGQPSEDAVFIHRDFHPANVLWQGETVSGVVDWVNACRGPRGVDVAHCRTNLALIFGVDAADEFKNAYLERADGKHHPFWDVASILDMSLPEPEFYRPWSEFGLPTIGAPELRRQTEIYLTSVLKTAAG